MHGSNQTRVTVTYVFGRSSPASSVRDGTSSRPAPFQPCMDSLWQDVRLGARSLLKAPLFTAAVVITLGLGIGANAAVFTIVNRMLLKPLPVRDPGGLYVLAVQHEGNEDPHNLSWLDYQDFRDKSGAFADLAAYEVDFVGLSAGNRAERIAVSYVTSNYFSMLGVPPGLGRLLQPGDAQEPGTDPVIVLGHSYWAKRFNRDPSIVGRAVVVKCSATSRVWRSLPASASGCSPRCARRARI